MSKKNKKHEEAVTEETEAQQSAGAEADKGEASSELEFNGNEDETVQAMKDRLQRLAAEYQNFRKQADRRNTDTRRFVKRDLVQQMLPIVDNFGHAMQALDQGQDAQNVLFGVKMIHEMLGKFLEDNGITPIAAKGADFDPSLHEAVSSESTDEVRENTILSEVQRGYKMGDLIVRHARVIVAAPKAEDQTPAEPESAE